MPKKGAGGKKKGNDVKSKVKHVEDKTFGLKNKKGKKQQQFIQQQMASAGVPKGPPKDKKDAKQKRLEELEMLNSLFKPIAQTTKKGEDPKSIVCEFFKKGQCKKGAKCKFSHDLAKDGKVAKIDVYSDRREEKEEGMDDWDQEELEKAIKQKHGKEVRNPTSIICKFFLEALEKQLYGWFWVCPNGGDQCKYRHALPPGYVLKRDKKKMEEEEEKMTIEELVERERAELGGNLTKVTEKTFTAWKKRKIAEKRKQLKQEQSKKKKALKEGKTSNMSGRELFQLRPEDWNTEGEDDGDDAFDVSALRSSSPAPGEDTGDASAAAAAAAAPEEIKTYDADSFRMHDDNDDDEEEEEDDVDDDDANDDQNDGAAAAAAAAPSSSGGKIPAAAAEPAEPSGPTPAAASEATDEDVGAAAAAVAIPAAAAAVAGPLDSNLFADEDLDDLDFDDDDDDDEDDD